MRRRPKQTSRFGTNNKAHGSKSLQTVLLFIVSAVLIALVGVANVIWKAEPVDERLCPKAGPEGFALILLDLTDEITPQQASSIQTLVLDFVENAEPGTLFSVGRVVPEGQQQDSIVQICKPRTGEVANELYENPKLIADQYQKNFLIPIRNAVEEMTAEPSAPNSPILESLQALVARTSGFRTLQTDGRSREVLIVSDLLQNSKNFSFYRGDSWVSFRDRGLANEISNSLRGAAVVWLEVTRNLRPQVRDDRFKFWKNYFDLAGVDLTKHEKIGNL